MNVIEMRDEMGTWEPTTSLDEMARRVERTNAMEADIVSDGRGLTGLAQHWLCAVRKRQGFYRRCLSVRVGAEAVRHGDVRPEQA